MEVQCAPVPNHKLAALHTADALQMIHTYSTLIANSLYTHCSFHNTAPPILCLTDSNPLDCTALQFLFVEC